MVRRFAFGSGLASILVLGWASTGSADAETAQEILLTLNLVTTGDVSTQSDIVGNSVVGGDLSGASFFTGGSNIPTSPLLYVYGTIASGPLNIDAGGTLFYAGSINPPTVNFNGGGGQNITLPPVTDFTAPLEALSIQLENEGNNPTPGTLIDLTGNTLTFNAGNNTGIVVFDISGSVLQTELLGRDIDFEGTGVTSFIIDVSGDFSQPNNSHINTLQPDALFNFYDATTVDVGSWSGASILAPDASVSITGGGNLSGSLFAKEFLGGGELHNDNLFNGALPPTTVPEPSTWAMMLAGFAGRGFVGFRRSRKQSIAAF